MATVSLIKNKYRVLHEVGRGGMGTVYAVVHEGLGTTYALKQLHLELENNPDLANRFRREAQDMAALQHPNIVRVFDIDSEPGFGTYLVMELIKGADLGQTLKRQGRLKYDDALRIGLAIASALDTAHRAGLVHRDIKPGNILIEEATGRAVVTDFGIAKRIEAQSEDSVTRTGIAIGTYRYCSREQIRNDKGVRIDGRADIYSLGVVLYEMYAGKRFLDGLSELEMVHYVGFESGWKPPLDYPEEPPPLFKRLIDQCLATNREERPVAAEVTKHLEECLRSVRDHDAGPAAVDRSIDLVSVDRERDGALGWKKRIDELGSADDIPAAMRAFEAAETLRTRGALTDASAKYREAAAAYQQAVEAAASERAARYRTAIETLLPEVQADADELESLQERLLVLLGETVDGAQNLQDVKAQLEAIRQVEDNRQLQTALTQLQTLKDGLTAHRDAAAGKMRDGMRSMITDLGLRWEALMTRAGEFATPDQARHFEGAVHSARTALEQADWQPCHTHAIEAQAFLEQSEKDLREKAATAVAAVVDELRTALGDLNAKSQGATTEPAVNLEDLDRDLRRRLQDGQLNNAKARADEALAVASGALDHFRRQERERATAARSKLDQLLAEMDLDATRALVPELLQAADLARTQAAAAADRGQYGAAAAEYDRAVAGYSNAQQRLFEHQSARLDSLEQEVRVLLDRVADVPAEIAGAAAAQAQAWLQAPRSRNLTARLAAAEQVQASLTAAIGEADLLARTVQRQTAVEARRSAVTALGPSWRQLRPPASSIKKAATAVRKRRWADALDLYDQAEAALANLEEQLRRAHLKARPTTPATHGPADPTVVAPSLTADTGPSTWKIPSIPLSGWIGGTSSAVMAVAFAAWLLEVGPFVPEPDVKPPAVESPAAEPAAMRPAAIEPAAIGPPARPVAVVPPPRIASFVPQADAFVVPEGTTQSFSISVDGRGVDGDLPIEWRLDGERIASNVEEWHYAPDYQASGDRLSEVEVVIGNGSQEGQRRSWRLDVRDVNRAPAVRSASHPASTQVQAKVGDVVQFRVAASDDDGDPLKYRWTVDGEPAGTDAPELELAVAADHRVELTINDGKDSVSADWRVAALTSFKFNITPARLERLRYDEPQEFALSPQPGTRASDTQYKWQIDGRNASDAARFVFKDYNPAMVRAAPVTVTAVAQDGSGHTFQHEWKLQVLPPAPELERSSPASEGALDDAEIGRPRSFEIVARKPIGNQHFTYVYEVDGKRAAGGGDSRFEFAPKDENRHEIVAYVEDNYGQSSPRKIRWSVKASEIVQKVEAWLKEYQGAWNTRDATKLAAMRKMPEETAALETALRDKNDLQVTLSGLRIEKFEGDRAKASYRRNDRWVGPDGKSRSMDLDVEHTFRWTGRELLEVEARQRPIN